MWVVTATGLGLVLFGVRGLVTRARELKFGADVPLLLWTHAMAVALAWISGGTLLITANMGAGSLAWLMNSAMVLCLVSIGVAGLTARLVKGIRTAEVGSTRAFLAIKARESMVRSKVGLKNGAKIIAPTGWSELQFGAGALDRVMAPRTFLLVYVAGLAVLPILLAVFFTYALRGGSAVEQRVLSIVFGYNALFVVSSLTAATLGCVLLLVILKFASLLLVNLDIARAFRSVATWTGYGTAAGVITAAMLPVVNAIVPLSTSSALEADLTAVINPDLLIDLPAAGAVVGYGVGLMVSIVVLCRNAQNLIIRRLLSPVVFLSVLAALKTAGLGPQGLFAVIAQSAAASMVGSEVDCLSGTSASTFATHLGEAPWVLHLLTTCSQPFMIGDWAFVGSVGVFVFTVAFIRIAVDYQHGLTKVGQTL